MATFRTDLQRITLSLCFVVAHIGLARADLLDPLNFTSLGTLNLASDSFTIDTDTLEIRDGSNTLLFTGVVDNQGGLANPGTIPEIAVFTFADIDLANSANLTITGVRALALLSQGDVSIDTALRLNGGGDGNDCGGSCVAESGGPGGFGGGLATDDGLGPGGGGHSSQIFLTTAYSGAGGGFGSQGEAGVGNVTAGAAGVSYGELSSVLQGGSGGGGAENQNVFGADAGGGGGGGALEIGALGAVIIGSAGVLEASGGLGNQSSASLQPFGGNGSGGGIRVHAEGLLTIQGTIQAQGGDDGSTVRQSDGGGGRVLISGPGDNLTSIIGGIIDLTALTQGIDVSPGTTSPLLDHGVITVSPRFTIVPSGQTYELGAPIASQAASTTLPAIEVIARSLQITSGGEVTVPAGGHTNRFEIELRSPLASITGTDTLTNANIIRGTGSVEIPVINVAGGEINAVNDTLTFTQAVTSNAGAQINAINSTLTFNGGLTNNGELNLINSNIIGSVASTATSNATLVGSNSVSNDYTMAAADTLFIGLGGMLLGEFDTLSIGGDAALAGALNISLDPGFSLTVGDQFEILDIVGAQSGGFAGLPDGASVGSFSGIDLLIDYDGGDGNDVTLLAALPGDFDFDGDVDGNDFLLWQRDPSVGSLADWEANYGTVALLAAASAAVPEPATGIMLLFGMMGLIRRTSP